jgi:rubrerythrin
MVTMVGTQDNIEDLVEALLTLEQDALAAYEQTIKRLENKEYARKVAEFRDDHLEHVSALTKIANKIGVAIPDGSVKSVLTKGKVVIADMVGSDSLILTAMKTNEYDTVTAYENAVEKLYLTPELRDVCEKGLSDERRHRDWMDAASERPDKAA